MSTRIIAMAAVMAMLGGCSTSGGGMAGANTDDGHSDGRNDGRFGQAENRHPSSELLAWGDAEPLAVDRAAFDGRGEEFKSHKTHVTMTTPFAPVESFFRSLQTRLKRKLMTRGEAHVTVLTPPEHAVLTQRVAHADIERLAREKNIQAARLEPVCLGKGEAELSGKLERTYFIVVKSPELLELRRAWRELYVQRGGSASDFDPDRYYPHITVGFTKADLHESQGVIKGINSCLYPLDIR